MDHYKIQCTIIIIINCTKENSQTWAKTPEFSVGINDSIIFSTQEKNKIK